jgi:outer membrane receptor for Fe3+-dicitrate
MPSQKTKLAAEYTNMDYQMQQAGGLTDAQFAENLVKNLRERNWFELLGIYLRYTDTISPFY